MARFPKKEPDIIALVEQLTGKELEYRIIAVNKADDGELSNMMMVVL